jgi:hypothetical protein
MWKGLLNLTQGFLSLAASSVAFDYSGKLTADVPILANFPAGMYEAEVTNPDGQKTALSEGFEVTKKGKHKKHKQRIPQRRCGNKESEEGPGLV